MTAPSRPLYHSPAVRTPLPALRSREVDECIVCRLRCTRLPGVRSLFTPSARKGRALRAYDQPHRTRAYRPKERGASFIRAVDTFVPGRIVLVALCLEEDGKVWLGEGIDDLVSGEGL